MTAAALDPMIDAHYFDGRTSRRHPVTLVFEKRVITLRGLGLRRSERLSRMKVSERLEHAPRMLRFKDGGFVEIHDPGLEKLLRRNGYRDPWVVRFQQNWLLSLTSLIMVLALLIAAYQWGVPWAADHVAQHLPPSIEKKVGDKWMEVMDGDFMKPSKLDAADQARLQKLFAAMKQPRGEKTAYRIEMRDGKVGPNAFALPNGVIVMTDQLVRVAGNDQAILGVLSHELGHVQRRHSLRKLLQTVGVGVILNLVVGDVSSVLTTMPTVLLNQKYSRDFEREADQYAIDMMRENRLPLSPMADMFVKMRDAHANDSAGAAEDKNAKRQKDQSADEDEEDRQAPKKTGKAKRKAEAESEDPEEYFSSHPSDAERIAKLRAADAAMPK